MGGEEQGLVWSLTIIVMPILLGLALAYGAWQSWRRRRGDGPPPRRAGEIRGFDRPSDAAQTRHISRVGVISVVAFVVLGAVLVALFV